MKYLYLIGFVETDEHLKTSDGKFTSRSYLRYNFITELQKSLIYKGLQMIFSCIWGRFNFYFFWGGGRNIFIRGRINFWRLPPMLFSSGAEIYYIIRGICPLCSIIRMNVMLLARNLFQSCYLIIYLKIWKNPKQQNVNQFL